MIIKKVCFLSQALKEVIAGKEELEINLVGEVMLRGKSQALKIYSIDEEELTKNRTSDV